MKCVDSSLVRGARLLPTLKSFCLRSLLLAAFVTGAPCGRNLPRRFVVLWPGFCVGVGALLLYVSPLAFCSTVSTSFTLVCLQALHAVTCVLWRLLLGLA